MLVLSMWCGALVAGADALFVAGPASAEIVLPNDPNGHAEVTSLVDMSSWWCGRYLGGAEASGTQLNPADYSYSMQEADGAWFESVDHRWMQDIDANDPLLVDMGLETAEVDLVASIDHGPVPEEAMESTVYGSNDLLSPPGTWEAGDISTIFLNGPTNWVSDDYSTRWVFSQPYRYFAVGWGGPKALWSDGDNEVDALCASNGQQPAPWTANAGPDQTVVEGSTVVLDASGTAPPSGVLSVPGSANIFAAGQSTTIGFAPSGAGSGVLPTQYSGAVVPGGVIQFTGAAGLIYPYPGAPGSGPDGDPGGSPSMAGFSGLSGYRDNMYAPLVGVFLSDATPAGADSAPPTLDFTGNHDFTDLSPELRQVFFIGDGQTAGAVVQNFHVPAGATRLFLGVAEGLASGPGYFGDPNSGAWQITPTGPSAGVSYSWQLTGAAGPPIQLSSTTDVAPSFSVFDEGTYTFAVTVTDGQHSATDDVTVTVTNADPAISQVASDPTATDGLTEVTVSFTDPGIFDAHTVAFSWGDGSPTDIVPAQVGGTGWGYGFSGHRYATTGSKTVSVWVTDTDGGLSASQTVTVDVGGAGQGEVVLAGPGAALWATSTTANDTIKVTGSNNRFAGRVHSNREIRVSGSQHQFTGGTEYVTALNVTGSGTVFNPAAVQTAAGPAPFTYAIADWRPGGSAAVAAGAGYHNMSSACQGGGQNRKWQPSGVIAAGVYYVDCNIQISGSSVGGNVTFIADGTIKVSGSTSSWTPYAAGLLFLAGSTDSRAVDLSGSGHVYHGSIYAGSGGIELTGSGNTLDCGIVATTARVSGSNNQIGGANCAGNPGGGTGTTVSIGAPPLVVPTLSHTFTADRTDVEPGETLTLSDTVRNGQTGPGGIGGGARVFMPVLLGVDNPNPTAVTVTGVTYKLEIHDPGTNAWSTLATTDPGAPAGQRIVTLGLRPNPTVGVTYSTGGNLLDGTVVPAGLLASWAGVATIDLTPGQVNTLMNPTAVDAIRNTAELTVSSTNVRRIARFDDQPLNVLRTAPQADLNHIQSTVTSAISAPVTLTDPAVSGFANLTPGQVATATTSTVVPVPPAKSGTETDAAYRARLASLDNRTIYAGAYVRASAGVGDVWAPQQLAATRRHLPILDITATSNTLVPAGVDATWTITITNTGIATATAINLAATLAGPGTITLAGVPATLAPGTSAAVTATAATAGSSGTHDATFTVRWSNTGAAPDSYGPITASASVRWLTLTEPVTISQIQGNFYPLAPGATSFTATTADTAVFGQNFPNIAFNPPTDVVPDNTFGIDPTTVPFTDVTVGVDGHATGTLPAQQGVNAAGVGGLADFQATLTGTLTVTAAGNQTLSVIADDGFALGIGDGATRVSGPNTNTPAVTAMQGFAVMGGHNTLGGVATYEIVVNFPTAGVYDFEIDYLNHPGTATLVFGTAGTPTADRVLWLGNDMVGDVFATNLDGTVHSRITGIGRTGMASDGTRLFMGNNAGLIEIRSLDGNTLLDSFVIPRIVYATEDLAWDPVRQRLWRVDNDNILRLINPDTHAQEAQYQLPTADPVIGTLGGIGLDYDAGRDELIVAYCQQPVCVATNSMVGTVDPDTGTPTGTLFYTPGRFGGGVAHDPTDDTLWIGGHTDVVHYTRTGTLLGTWPRPLPGAYVDGLTLAPSTTPVTNTIPPIIELVLSPASATNSTGTTATVTATVTAADSSPVVGAPVTLAVTGANPQPFLDGITNSVGQADITYPALNPGTDTIRGSTISGFAPTVSNQVNRTFTGPPVIDTGGNGNPGPTASNCNPTEGTTVTVPTVVTCTLTPQAGTTITSWTVSLQAAGTAPNTRVIMASGSGSSISTTIDPTQLRNGQWAVQIDAVGSDGGATTTELIIVVDGRLKLGRQRVSYVDMSLPVRGVPIEVTRTYDSLDRLEPGDFGHGWTLGVSNIRVESNGPLGRGGWQRVACGVGLFVPLCYETTRPHIVTVTWPQGRTETFDFTPGGINTFFPIPALPAYTGRSGTTSKLEPMPEDLVAGAPDVADGNIYEGAFADGPIYDPTRFKLTTRDGTTYVLDRTVGMLSATDRDGNIVEVSPSGITSTDGVGISFSRDGEGRINRITGPDGQTVSYRTDADGDLVGLTDPNGYDANYAYTDHHLTSASGSGTPARTYSFHSDGRMATVTTANGTTSFDNDVAARTESILAPDGSLTTVLSYSEFGDVTRQDQVFDGRVLTTQVTSDDQGRPLSITDPLGNTTEGTYDSAGNLTRIRLADGTVTDTTFTELGQPIDVTTAGQLRIRNTYDEVGHLLTSSRTGAGTTAYTYDLRGRLDTVTDAVGRQTRYSYGAHSRIVAVHTPAGTAAYTYDSTGRVLSAADEAGNAMTATYDADGHIQSVTDPNGQVQSWHYNEFGQVDVATDKAGRSTIYRYDDFGQLVEKVDRNGVTATFTYSPQGLLTSSSAGGLNATYAYDPLGRPTAATNADATVTLAWDDADHLVRQSSAGTTTSNQPSVVLDQTVDPLGRTLNLTSPGSSTAFSYNAVGDVVSVADSTGPSFALSYDSAGRLLSLARSNGTNDAYGYDAVSQLLSKLTTKAAAVLARSDYHYNLAGLRDQLDDVDGSHLFGYDPAGQLTSASHPTASGLGAESYSYDAIGRRTESSVDPVGSITYDGADRIQGDATNTYRYDAEGNRIEARNRTTGVTTSYTWNPWHQLTAVTTSTGSQTLYRYDAIGRRIEVDDNGSVTRFVHDGANLREAYNGANQRIATFVVSPSGYDDVLAIVDSGGGASFPVTDGIGTVTTVLDNTGTVIARHRYDAFGNAALPATGNVSFGWTGLRSDLTGLVHARARDYDPRTGSFLSEDPIAHQTLYRYGNNSPLLYTDPTGLQDLVEESEEDASNQPATYSIRGQQYECPDMTGIKILGDGMGSNARGKFAEMFIGMLLDYQGAGATPGNWFQGQSGAGRIPDFQSGNSILEVKNVSKIGGGRVTKQIKDYAAASKDLTIFTRGNTKVSSAVQELVDKSGGTIRIARCLPG